MTRPWKVLATVATDEGALELRQRGDDPANAEFLIVIAGRVLMTTTSRRSEEGLASLAFEHLGGRKAPRVLVGGLGMGFTARAALDCLGADAEVVVVEAAAEVIAWNRDPALLGQLAAMPLGDRRLSVVNGDVGDAIERAAGSATDDARFDAILLDVDNGPSALSTFTNRRLYSEAGLISARLALRAGGVLAVWSTFQDARFTALLRAVGFDARTKRVLAGDGTPRRHVLWLARPATITAPASPSPA